MPERCSGEVPILIKLHSKLFISRRHLGDYVSALPHIMLVLTNTQTLWPLRKCSQLTGGQRVEDAVRSSAENLPVVYAETRTWRSRVQETRTPLAELLELHRAGFLKPVLRNDKGEISSVGSLSKHADGSCTPCIFWFRGICAELVKCSYCQFCHPGRKVKRYKPNKRIRAVLRDLKEQQATLTQNMVDQAAESG